MLSRVISAIAGFALFQSVIGAPAYFRSDFGVPLYSKVLPGDLGTEAAQFWRSELEPGHSTPIAENGRIFVTTAGRDGLATVCLEAKSGRELWKRKLKIEKVEEFHPQEGNAAMASAACDGERVFVFFGSYGLICYDLEGKQL